MPPFLLPPTYPGSLMALAWGVLIPVGIILALFYKVVWPNGQWFYVSQTSQSVGDISQSSDNDHSLSLSPPDSHCSDDSCSAGSDYRTTNDSSPL